MLGHRSHNDLLLEKVDTIRISEKKINLLEKVYMFTWSPDSKELPDCDFILQHKTNVNFLADYLKTCFAGCICLEAHQRGTPHYHGWYQIEPKFELARIAMTKTLIRMGNLKITEARNCKINSWYKKANGLYYYKEDCIDSMLSIEDSIITCDSKVTINWELCNLLGFFDIKGPEASQTAQNRVTDLQYYKDFYTDSLGKVK
jgi:hypothetical protein